MFSICWALKLRSDAASSMLTPCSSLAAYLFQDNSLLYFINNYFNKPRSVPIKLVANIYLCKNLHPLIRFYSFIRIPLPNFGFLTCGVYPFHFFVSKKIVSVALYARYHGKALGNLRRRQALTCRRLFIPFAQTLRSLQIRVSVDFPLLIKN